MSRQAPDCFNKHPEGLDNTPEVAGIKKKSRREAAVRRDSGVRQHSCVDYYPEACLACEVIV